MWIKPNIQIKLNICCCSPNYNMWHEKYNHILASYWLATVSALIINILYYTILFSVAIAPNVPHTFCFPYFLCPIVYCLLNLCVMLYNSTIGPLFSTPFVTHSILFLVYNFWHCQWALNSFQINSSKVSNNFLII